jgi:1D-myo-inositol-tetrakisphosphate 5-kinase/inositol-polyphosphate multikinase
MISTPKSYGYALKVETLPEGFKRFFGLPGEIEELPVSSEEQEKEGEKKVEEIVPPTAVPVEQEITPEVVQKYKRSLLRILRSLHAGITEFETLMRFLEIRFVGASLLIVYEGDPSSLEWAWNVVDQEGGTRGDGLDDLTTLEMGDDDDSDEEGMELVPPSGGRESGRGFFGGMIGGFGAERKDGSSGFGLLDRTPSPPPRKKRRAVGSDESDGGIHAHETHEPNDDHDDDEDEEDDDNEDSRPRPFVFRLIDFAHTRLVQGEGRDESVLKGLETTLRLIQGRIDELTEDDGTQ